MNPRPARSLRRPVFAPAAALLVVALLLVLPGCGGGRGAGASPEISNAATALQSLRSLRENLANGQGRLFALSETLREATAPQDLALGPWFQEYKLQREGVRTLAVSLREGHTDLQDAERVYIRQWEQDLGAIADPQLRATSVERRAKLRDDFGAMGNDLDDTKQRFQPLLRSLSDLEVYLQNDLTSTGVERVKGRLGSTAADSETLGRQVSTNLAKLDELINELAPVKG